MAKKQSKRTPVPETVPLQRRAGQLTALVLCTALYFLAVCFTGASTIKGTALVLALLALAAVFLFFSTLRSRMGIPLLLAAAVVLMDGVSTLYAVSGKFALYEFLKVLAAFSLALVLLSLAPGEGVRPGRWIAKALAGFSALAGLISIDLLSTRLLSGPVLEMLGLFTPDYGSLAGVEAGVRMTSMFENPNVFAGVAGLGVLLSLGLVCSSENKNERAAQTAVLYVNSLSFLLAFSMGATASIAVAFLALLALERRGSRTGLLLLMVETLAFAVLAAGVISMTSFQAWDGLQPVPMLCTLLGGAALCLTDRFLGQRLAARLEGRGRLIPILVLSLLAALAAFVLAAYHLTGPATLEAGGYLRRAAYPEAGTYTLTVETGAPLDVAIESQNRQETMMHTSTILYRGEADGASFTVPEDSLVVYFNFYAPEGGEVLSAGYGGERGSGAIPLGYRLLPGFMANRLQGLWANENAIQRLVFFEDGMKLFQRSPAIGLGLGAFENGVKSVQSFSYVTRYAHNHYIQTLAETGVVGLALFLLLLGGSAAAVLFERKRGEGIHPLAPALGAALAFMAGHAATEVVFSAYPYLPIAFGVFALISLCCGGALPRPRLGQKAQAVSLLAISALIGVYAVLLGCNMRARTIATTEGGLSALEEAVRLDRFEWADYALTYVNEAASGEVDGEVRRQADEYAARLAKLDSNSAPIYLASYYFQTARPEEGLAMVEKYVGYVSSDGEAWQKVFDLLAQYEQDTEVYRAGVLRVAGLLEDWNRANMGEIVLDENARALIARMGG